VTPEPCRCETPNLECRRAGRPMDPILFDLCGARNGVPAGVSERWRRRWDREAARRPPAIPPRGPCAHLGPPALDDAGRPREVRCAPCAARRLGLPVVLPLSQCLCPDVGGAVSAFDCRGCKHWRPAAETGGCV
jgi:hypothetical protein